MEEYFRPYIGEFYARGIAGDHYLFIGGHHYCKPDEWRCNAEPSSCLQDRDKICPGYMNKPCKIREKCSEYLNAEQSNETEKCDICNRGRFLHCETKISINDMYEHLRQANKESNSSQDVDELYRDRAVYLSTAFNQFFKEMERFLPDNEVKEHINNGIYELLNYVSFSNYIQHYTKLTNGYFTAEIPEEELSNKANLANKARLKKIIKDLEEINSKDQKEGLPPVIVLLHFREIKKTVKEILKDKGYIELEEIENDAKKYFIFCTKESQLYERYYTDSFEKMFIMKSDKLIKICNKIISTECEDLNDSKNRELVNALIAAVYGCIRGKYSVKKTISSFSEYDWLKEDTIKRRYSRRGACRAQLQSKKNPFKIIEEEWRKIKMNSEYCF